MLRKPAKSSPSSNRREPTREETKRRATKHVAKTQNEKGRRRAEWERRGDDL